MTRLSVATLARDADRIVSRVADNGERIVLRKGNKNMAVIVSMSDAARLNRIAEEEEDRRDIEEAMRRLSDPKEKRIPYGRARKELGLA